MAMRRLMFPPGAVVALVLSTAWPTAMVMRYGTSALALWMTHVTDRLSTHQLEFAGEPWWEYVPGLLIQAMPWTPLALVGAWSSLRRAVAVGRLGRSRDPRAIAPAAVVAGDRLLWVWSAAPMALLALATVKNAHYAIAAQVPWSVWAALGLSRLAGRLARRGWTPDRLRRAAIAGFAALGLAYGLGFWLLAPRLDHRGVEWAFYESAARLLPPGASVLLLYDDWDRNPYETPFGAFPHDLAVRLFYLRRPAQVVTGGGWRVTGGGRRVTSDGWRVTGGGWRVTGDGWVVAGDGSGPAFPPTTLFLIGRDRDRPELERLGSVEVLARGPSVRFDRTYTLFRISVERSDGDAGEVPAPLADNDSLSSRR
jgi:hypothetical protein